MSANAHRKAVLALKNEMTTALAAESDRRKRKQLQKEYEARIEAMIANKAESNNGESKQVENMTSDNPQAEDEEFKFVMKEKGMSKSEIKKEKREQRRREEEAKLLQQHRRDDMADVELRDIQKLLDEEKLKIVRIPSDGNCLYRALEHQLQLDPRLPAYTYRELRRLAADHMLKHRDEYFHYLDEEYLEQEEGFDFYIKRLRDTDEWGGELEIKLISDALKVPITVYTSTGRREYAPSDSSVASEPTESMPRRLNISFHKHMMASAHYNSLERLNSNEQPKIHI